MIKLVAFDWNGTILADTNAMVAADNAVFKHFGLPKTNLKELQAAFKMPIRDYWLAMGLDAKVFDRNMDKVASIFMKTYEPLEKICRTRSGVRTVLLWLKKANVNTVIFSNHILQHIEKELTRLRISPFVNKILARTQGDNSHLHTKSKDQKLGDYVKSLKFKPRDVLVVGDTEEEIEIAKQFGFYSVGLTGGNISTVRLKAAKPDFLIYNLAQLKSIITKLR